MRTLRLLNLHCNKIDNNDTKINETILTVENSRFLEFGPESMRSESNWNINADIQFNEKATIALYDDDSIHNLSNAKHIRTYTVGENEIPEGQKKVSFTSDNANYILTYQIT